MSGLNSQSAGLGNGPAPTSQNTSSKPAQPEADYKALTGSLYAAMFPVVQQFLSSEQHPNGRESDTRGMLQAAHEATLKAVETAVKQVKEAVEVVRRAPTPPFNNVV